VYVADTGDDVKKGATRYGSDPQTYTGNVKLLGAEDQPGGDDATRAEALKRYQGRIDSSRLGNSSVLWQDIRDTHERALKETEGQ
jgi:hypothetical protein